MFPLRHRSAWSLASTVLRVLLTSAHRELAQRYGDKSVIGGVQAGRVTAKKTSKSGETKEVMRAGERSPQSIALRWFLCFPA